MPLTFRNTRGQGDCAFHAAFGKYNGHEYVCSDLATRRKQVGDQVRAINAASHELFPSVREAIKELIRGKRHSLHLESQQFPIITQRQEIYKSDDEGFEDLDEYDAALNGAIVGEYAKFIETPGMWLLPCELSVLAYALNIRIHQFGKGKEGELICIEIYNQTAAAPQEGVNIFFNENHYEAMSISEQGSFYPNPFSQREVNCTPTFSLSSTDNYPAAGLKSTLHGDIYQLKILMLFLYRGYQKRYSFRLATEMKAAEKFDDLVFEYKKPGDTKSTFLCIQAKHRQDNENRQDNEKLITYTNLVKSQSGPYGLGKYFISYQRIIKSEIFKNGELGKVCLFTNIAFDLDSVLDPKTGFKLSDALEEITKTDDMLDATLLPGKKYQFKNTDFVGKKHLYELLRQSGDERRQLAKALYECMNSSTGTVNKNHKLFNEDSVYTWLIDNNIINDTTRRITSSFAKGQGLSTEALEFKALYDQGANPKSISLADSEIDGFLNHLVFAVSQPDEKELGNIITRELGKEFNLIDSDFVYAELQKAMLDWMKQKEGSFLTQNAAQNFADTMRQKLSRLALIGSTLDYQAELEHYDITFKPAIHVRSFLKGYKQSMVVQVPYNATLGSVRVYQTLQSLGEYLPSDSYIFISLQSAVKLTSLLIDAFAQTRLLILTCDETIKNSKSQQLIQALLGKQTHQKILFVMSRNTILPVCVSSYPNLEIIEDRVGFEELSEVSQKNIQQHPIFFQGRQTALAELVDKLDSIVDAEVLSELLSGKKIQVGEPPENFEAKNYSIDRTLIGVQITDFALRENTTDIFVVENMPQNDLNTIVKTIDLKRYMGLDSQIESLTQFQALCVADTQHSVHLLKRENNAFIWQRSHGSLSNLRKYTQLISVNALPNTSIIISAEPGMGKSTYLANLALTNPSLWIVKINLGDKEEQIEQASFNIFDGVIHFLMQNTSLLAQKIFEDRLKNGNNIALVFDGFDEIQAPEQQKILQLLQLLKTTAVEKIIVATREYKKKTLEEGLSVFAHHLKPFNEEDFYLFLEKFWKDALKLKEIDPQKVRFFGERLFLLFPDLSNDTAPTFIGIPLQAKLLAGGFIEEFAKFYHEENSEISLPMNLSLVTLYERFIRIKYNIVLQEKYGYNTYSKQDKLSTRLSTERLNRIHPQLAFKVLFPNIEMVSNTDPLSREDIDLIQATGIVQFIEREPRFLHRTFAEYILAQWLVRMLEKELPDSKNHEWCRNFLIQFVFKKRNKVLFDFIMELVAISPNTLLKETWLEIRKCQITVNDCRENLNVVPVAEKSKDIEIAELRKAREKISHYLAIKSIEENEGIMAVLNADLFRFYLLKHNEPQIVRDNLLFLKSIINDPHSVIDIGVDIAFALGFKQRTVKSTIIVDIEDMLWHYIFVCFQQKIPFDQQLISNFREVDYSDIEKYIENIDKLKKRIIDIFDLLKYLDPEQIMDSDRLINLMEELPVENILRIWVVRNMPVTTEQLRRLQLNDVDQKNQLYRTLVVRWAAQEESEGWRFLWKSRELVLLEELQAIQPMIPTTAQLSDKEVEILFDEKFAIEPSLGINVVKVCRVFTPYMAGRFNSLLPDHQAKNKKFAVPNNVQGLIRWLLVNEVNNVRVNKQALINMLKSLLSFWDLDVNDDFSYELLPKFELTMLEINNFCEVSKSLLNSSLLNENMTNDIIELLGFLLKNGFQLIDNGNTLFFQDPNSDFEYPLELTYHNHRQQLLSTVEKRGNFYGLWRGIRLNPLKHLTLREDLEALCLGEKSETDEDEESQESLSNESNKEENFSVTPIDRLLPEVFKSREAKKDEFLTSRKEAIDLVSHEMGHSDMEYLRALPREETLETEEEESSIKKTNNFSLQYIMSFLEEIEVKIGFKFLKQKEVKEEEEEEFLASREKPVKRNTHQVDHLTLVDEPCTKKPKLEEVKEEEVIALRKTPAKRESNTQEDSDSKPEAPPSKKSKLEEVEEFHHSEASVAPNFYES